VYRPNTCLVLDKDLAIAVVAAAAVVVVVVAVVAAAAAAAVVVAVVVVAAAAVVGDVEAVSTVSKRPCWRYMLRLSEHAI